MTDLLPLSALGARVAAKAEIGGLTLVEMPEVALASLALRRASVQPSPFGFALPGPYGWTVGPTASAFWTGPDQWMFELDGRASDDILPELAQQAPECSITEQTDGWTRFDITSGRGEAPILAMLEKLVNIDPDRLTPGTATRTGLHHQSVFVIRRSATVLSVWGMRSLAGSLWHALTGAARRHDMTFAPHETTQTRRDSRQP